MNSVPTVCRGLLPLAVSLCFALALELSAQTPPVAARPDEIVIASIEGTLEVLSPGAADWIFTQTNQIVRPGYRLRTGPNSRVTLKLSDSSVVPFGALTEIEILPPHEPRAKSGLNLIRGILSFFDRERPSRIRVITRGAVAGIEGTEFVLEVVVAPDGTERTILSLIDGRVRFANPQGFLVLTNGQQAVAIPGQAPTPTAGFIVNNVLQWAFYYPAVLDLAELSLPPEAEQALAESLAAYRSGDLLAALARYPANRQPQSDSERVYYAAVLLSVGQAVQTEQILADLRIANVDDRNQRLANALRTLIAAVKRDTLPRSYAPTLATELLARSYYEQARALGDESLNNALRLARQATLVSPKFGFAWTRVAELEFSFGRTGKALDALNRALELAPRNAQAHALQGFLFAARNDTRKALASFDRALAIDSGLANAWLGRGLARIRRGEAKRGREDLLIAAALEPRRAVLRSYLAKSFADGGRGVPASPDLALHELALAQEIDPHDPTAWLYSALIKQQQNRINEAIEDLEHSQDLNENRALYRSKLLLDQDRAVRSANLAQLYADADLTDVAVREAGHAVTIDYVNYSSHLFLANSYEVERRANLSNFRFETASLSEYLLANLLGPANGRLLAQPVTQLEYGTLFERNRLGLIANTEYFSHGAWHHSSAQYGTYNGSSYSLEAEYRTEPGERFNQDLEIQQLEGKFKHDLTPNDSLYFHVLDYRSEGGDPRQVFDESEIARTFRFQQKQSPTVLAGYHHEWSPQHHTLFLAGRFDDTLNTFDPDSGVLAADRGQGTVVALVPVGVSHTYRSRVELYSAEVQQIAVMGRQSFLLGARGQWSKQDVANRVELPFGTYQFLLGFEDPVAIQDEEVTTSIAALYAYDYLRLHDTLLLVGGLNYTFQSVPVNTASAPISAQRDHQDRLTPKAAIIWSPVAWSSIRAAYAQSLGGAGLGQSWRIEPSHLAGLVQAFREPVPPSLVGQLHGADIETSEVLWEGRLRRTYVLLGAQQLVADADRQLGLFFQDDPLSIARPLPGLIRERVHFREQAVDFAAHQLISDEWSFGVRYRLAYARLQRSFPEYPGLGIDVDDQTDWRGWLHSVILSGLYRHRSGAFARAEGVFFGQDRERDEGSIASDNFWQVNFVVGYRFPKQRAEVAVGLLNLLDNDYRLDPINQYADLRRARTFYARLRVNF